MLSARHISQFCYVHKNPLAEGESPQLVILDPSKDVTIGVIHIRWVAHPRAAVVSVTFNIRCEAGVPAGADIVLTLELVAELDWA